MKPLFMLALGLGAAQTLSACGAETQESTRTASTNQAIVGGQPALANQFPSIVSLTKGDVTGACGGTVIAPNWVLTAGHCMDASFRGGVTQVAGGILDLSDQGERLTVWRAYRHEDWAVNGFIIDNDVALLRLASPSSQPAVNLASDGFAMSVGTDLTVAGWGDTAQGAMLGSNALRYVDVPLVEQDVCETSYPGLPDTTICAGYAKGGKDACQGDSGGPIFLQAGGQQTQVGIVSSGDGCAQASRYGMYASVASFRDWIESTIAQGEQDFADLGPCVAQCDATSGCQQGEDLATCNARNDGCLCACSGDEPGLCGLTAATANEALNPTAPPFQTAFPGSAWDPNTIAPQPAPATPIGAAPVASAAPLGTSAPLGSALPVGTTVPRPTASAAPATNGPPATTAMNPVPGAVASPCTNASVGGVSDDDGWPASEEQATEDAALRDGSNGLQNCTASATNAATGTTDQAGATGTAFAMDPANGSDQGTPPFNDPDSYDGTTTVGQTPTYDGSANDDGSPISDGPATNDSAPTYDAAPVDEGTVTYYDPNADQDTGSE